MSTDISLHTVDTRITNSCLFKMQDGKIEFQFPPKVLSESNSSQWMEIDAWSYEPIRIHKGSSGRQLKMEWEYVAKSGTWTPKKIYEQLTQLKSYFYNFESKGQRVYPIVLIEYKPILNKARFRIMNVSISYSPEIILSEGNAYPIHTKVSVDLTLATNLAEKKSEAMAIAAESMQEAEEGKVKAEGLVAVKPEWY